MPRDLVLLTPRMPAVRDLMLEVRASGRNLAPIRTGNGAMIQLIDRDDDTVALSLMYPVIVTTSGEVDRLLPDLPGSIDYPVYWSEAWAPRFERGEPGVEIARLLAERCGGVCIVQDVGHR